MHYTEFDEEKRQLLEKKNALTIAKVDIQAKLSALRNRLRLQGRLLPKLEYTQICQRQDQLKKKIVEIEKEIAPIKNRMTEIGNAEHLFHAQQEKEQMEASRGLEVFASPVIVQELVSLRQQYQEFAADLTRVSSMRQMAADFVIKLSRIIKDDLRRPVAAHANDDRTKGLRNASE